MNNFHFHWQFSSQFYVKTSSWLRRPLKKRIKALDTVQIESDAFEASKSATAAAFAM